MKATIEFDLIEEIESFEDACNGHKYKYILEKLDYRLKSILKHGERSQEVFDELEKLRDFLYDLVNEQNVTI